eukprot:scaffold8114_cov112-Isochrysis_galbana.AAC.6
MAPPTYASALTGDFLGVPPSPKRPREDEQPEVRRTAQSRARPWPVSNVSPHRPTLPAVWCGLTETEQRNRGQGSQRASPLKTS